MTDTCTLRVPPFLESKRDDPNTAEEKIEEVQPRSRAGGSPHRATPSGLDCAASRPGLTSISSLLHTTDRSLSKSSPSLPFPPYSFPPPSSRFPLFFHMVARSSDLQSTGPAQRAHCAAAAALQPGALLHTGAMNLSQDRRGLPPTDPCSNPTVRSSHNARGQATVGRSNGSVPRSAPSRNDDFGVESRRREREKGRKGRERGSAKREGQVG